jgi:hypothetical protein
MRGQRAARAVLDAHREKPFSLHFGYPCNSRGYYDEEFGPRRPGLRRVLSIGDSYAVGVVPHQLHFTTVCERMLGEVEVCNVGACGVGPSEYLVMLQDERASLEPDVVVVHLFLGNDLHGKVLDRSAPALARYFSRDAVLLWTVPERIARIRSERTALRAELSAADVQSAQPRFAVYTGEDPFEELPTLTEETYYESEARQAYTLCFPGEVDWPVVFKLLESMIAAAGETPIGFVLLPDEFQVEDEVWERVREMLDEPRLERDWAQAVLGEWFEREGVPYLDVLPHLRSVEPLADGRRHVFHERDIHLNARGNKVVGQALAQFVKDLLP